MQLNNIEQFIPLANAIKDAGGQFLFVGGCVRDAFLRLETKDYDAEVYGLTENQLLPLLESFGEVYFVGQSFGVFKIKGLNLDISLPRSETKTGLGHRGFHIQTDPYTTFKEAAKRRDFTINSIGFDPLTNTVLDPYQGVQDIKEKRLQATSAETFGEDPLRALRAAQFAARFEMTPTPALCTLLSKQNLDELPGERTQIELQKLLTKSRSPSVGFELLKKTNLIRFFPEIEALQGVAQNPYWHPEGDVWIHTMMVIDYAAKHRPQNDRDYLLMLAALCHDFGKPLSTITLDDGRVTAKGHEDSGVPPAINFLERLKIPKTMQKQIALLIQYHLKPHYFGDDTVPPEDIYYLARALYDVHLTITDLAWLGRVDAMGRTTEEAQKNICPSVDAFLEKCHTLKATDPHYLADRVTGAMLLTHGYQPGPHFTEMLNKARDIQYRYQLNDPEQIIATLKAEYPIF